jgi:chromosome segregation ATPase
MNDEEEKQVFDTLATSKQVLDSGAKLLAMRDEKIKALEAKLGEWRARAENAELELETARERLEVLDEVLDDQLDGLSTYAREFVQGDRPAEALNGDTELARELYDAGAVIEVGAETYTWHWTRFGLELRRRAKLREQKR